VGRDRNSILRGVRIACQLGQEIWRVADSALTGTSHPQATYLKGEKNYLRNFLITLVLSIGGTIVFWNFGLARLIWPAHPMLATTLIIGLAALVLQFLLSEKRQPKEAKSLASKQR